MTLKRLFATSRDGKIKTTTVHISPLNCRRDLLHGWRLTKKISSTLLSTTRRKTSIEAIRSIDRLSTTKNDACDR